MRFPRRWALLSLVLFSGCAEGPRLQTLPPGPAPPTPAPVIVAFRLAVSIDGQPRFFAGKEIHFVRTDLLRSRPPPPLRSWRGDPPVRRLGEKEESWYSVELLPGRYHLSAVSTWHFPTPRGVPPLVIEIPQGDKVAFAGSIAFNCRNQPPPDDPRSALYDCDPPAIRTDDAATAARLLGDPAFTLAIRAMRLQSEFTSPLLPARFGPWVLEPSTATDTPLWPIPESNSDGAAAALGLGTLAGSLTCGPLFAFCAAVMVPGVIVATATASGIEHHQNKVTRACNERLALEVREFDAEKRLRDALRERFAAAGRPLSNPADVPGASASAIVLRVAVLRVGVRGDTCLPGFNPLKAPDRYRADILAGVQAIDGATDELLFEEFLSNTEKLSPWDVLAGRSSLTPVGSRAACRRVREFCPKTGEPVLGPDLEPAIDAFADHVVRMLTQPAEPAVSGL